jgi:hypothetical protein
MSEKLESLKVLLTQYLADLDVAQANVFDFLNQQQIHLFQLNSAKQLDDTPQDVMELEELRNLVTRRVELLNLARSQGLNVTTLQDLAVRLDDSQGSLIYTSRLMKRKVESMRYASLSHWISCQKACLHYSQLVQLIANGGRKSLMTGSVNRPIQGGVILDASV